MYSWIASWFSDEDESNKEEALYAEKSLKESSEIVDEEWIYIEVIQSECDNRLIFIQSDESARNKAKMTEPFQKKKRRKRRIRSMSDETVIKIFRKSLYSDLPLIRKTYRQIRRLKHNYVRDDMSVTASDICRRQKTTSEILSSTFPGKENLFMVRHHRCYDDLDVSKIIENTKFIKNLFEGVFKDEVNLQFGLKSWLENLVQKRISAMKQTVELTDGWKKSGQFCIEWKPESKIEEVPQIKIVHKQYTITSWLKRINTFEYYKEVPDWVKRINVSYFHQSCGEALRQPILLENITDVPYWLKIIDVPYFHQSCGEAMEQPVIVENITDVPKWLQRMDICASPCASKIRSHYRRAMCAEQLGEFSCLPFVLPSQHAKLEYEEEHLIKEETPTKIDDDLVLPVYKSSTTQWATPRKTWFRPPAEDGNSGGNRVQYLCNSMINIAAVLATATCSTSAKAQFPLIPSVGLNTNTRKSSRKSAIPFGVKEQNRKAQESTTYERSKKHMNRMNATSKVRYEKKKKHTARTFSGGKCVRAR